jgi:6-methylsalicylic acid synthase
VERAGGGAPVPALSELAYEQAAPAGGGGARLEFVDVLEGITGSDRLDRICDEVAAHVAAEIRASADDLDRDRPLSQIGLDSVLTLAVRRRLEARFKLNLPATLLWNHPTVTKIADYLNDAMTPSASEQSVSMP